ncbi:tyrosine recombinase [Corynebacterium deserti GIMN1.010]|uniref:Tyrosine recombinase n=1 Tax=Corynebacterium deserti GIMN1.010 TaxID=931089 RepID=A0A0M3Q9P7_9CORY|nr:site-specific integrase [Corynebacterium deserti]ALC05963.1 tyrosine recombinase [Corynebacterium deserti GIMN1.010]
MAVQRRPKSGKPAKGKVRWMVRYRDPSGKEHAKSFSTEKEAKAYDAEQARNLARGSWQSPTTLSTTLDELMAQWVLRPMREGTVQAYELTRKNLGPLAAMPASALKRSDVEAWHSQLVNGRPWMGKNDRGVAPTTAREHVVRLSAVLNGAVDDEILVRNVVKLPRLPAGIQVLRSDIPDMDTVRAVVVALEEGGSIYPSRERVAGQRGKFRPVDRVQDPQPIIADMVRAAVGTGMRLSELCGLRTEDIDFLRREVRVEAQLAPGGKERVPTKTLSSVRTIPIADDLIAVLDRRVVASTNGWIFETARGTPYRAATAGGELRKTVTSLGGGVTFHSFRHLYASRLISAGVSVKQVQKVLGHASASTTLDVYAHFFPGDDELSRSAIAGMVDSCGQIAGKVPVGDVQ